MNLLHRKQLGPTLACLAAAIGALFLAQLPNDTRSEWFRSLIRPEILPRSIESKIGFIWTTIFMLAGLGTAAAVASVHGNGSRKKGQSGSQKLVLAVEKKAT